MNRFFELVDLYAICGIALVVERRRMRQLGHLPYVTPVLAFVGSVAVVYLIPLTAAMEGYKSPSFLPGRLSTEDMHVLASSLRIFLYSFLVAYLLLLPALSGVDRERYRRAVPTRRNIRWLVAVVFVIWAVHLQAGVGLSPSLLLSRALNPREYTSLRSGAGIVIYLRAAVFLVAFVMVGLRIVHNRAAGKSVRKYSALFVGLIVLDVLGGSKQSVIVGPLVLLYLWGANLTERKHEASAPATAEKQRGVGRALFQYVGAGIAVLALLWVAFGVMQTAQQKANGQTVTDHLISYEQETFYSARVIQDYDPSQSYLITGVKDVALGALPRALYPDKEPVGFFARYWRAHYTPNVVSYQATTFGVLAEAHMMFGDAGFVLYGVIFALLLAWMYRLQYSSNSWVTLAIGSFFVQWMYFIVRGGILASAMLYILVELVLIVALVKVCGLKATERRLRQAVDPIDAAPSDTTASDDRLTAK